MQQTAGCTVQIYAQLSVSHRFLFGVFLSVSHFVPVFAVFWLPLDFFSSVTNFANIVTTLFITRIPTAIFITRIVMSTCIFWMIVNTFVSKYEG